MDLAFSEQILSDRNIMYYADLDIMPSIIQDKDAGFVKLFIESYDMTQNAYEPELNVLKPEFYKVD